MLTALIKKLSRKGRFYASLRPSDVFLVYFPRSGGFWLQSVFASHLQSKHEGPAARFSYEDVERWTPNLNTAHYFQRQPLDTFGHLSDPRIFKVHAPPDRRLARVIFLVRDPRDAFLSHYYYLLDEAPGFHLSLEYFVCRRRKWPMNWNAYTNTWLRIVQTRGHLLIKYEDLMAAPHRWCRAAFAYAGVEATDQELNAAIDQAWRENLRRRTDLYDRLVKKGHRGLRDFRQDGVGAYRQAYSEQVAAAVRSRNREAMERLGYACS